MTEQAKVPEIRFAGFTDPWEQRKASEVFQIVDDRGHPTLPVLSATQNQGMIYRDDSGRYIGHDESNEIGYKRVLPGDFVVHLRSFQGGFAHSQYEGITSPAYTVFRAKEPTSHSDRFWKHWFMSEHFIAGLSTVTYGIRDGRSISVDEFMNTFSAFPAVEEQAAISRLLDYLDDLITLHQRKYDKLVIFKKSMLEKMFPKDGESVPEIRFAGFTDPWEQRKLGEIATRVTRKNEGESDLPLTISAQHGLVDQRTFFNNQVASKDMSGYYLLRKGEFAYNKSTSGDSPWGAVKRLVNYEKGCVSTLYICFGLDGTDPNYLVTYYETDCWHKGVQMIAAEGARNHGLLNIAPNDFFDTVLALPSSQEEQRRVGSLFARLDSLITLHQRKRQWLKWLDEGGEGTHHDIDILVFKFADDMKISVLCGVHACMTKSLGHTGNRYAGKQQQRGMGVP